MNGTSASCLRTLSLAAGFLLGVIATSAAEWVHSFRGPDVSGNGEGYAVGSDNMGLGNLLVIRCTKNDALELAFLAPSTPSEVDAAAKSFGGTVQAVQVLVKIDDGPVQKFDDAAVKPWNRNSIGIVIEGRNPALLALVRSIGTANSKIAVSVDMAGHKASLTFGASGSTAAINAITNVCKLDEK